MSMPICPFTVGTIYYKPVSQPEKVRIPCPVCAGQKQVMMILGTGEHLEVPCEACGLGFEKSRGYIEEYHYTPRAVPYRIQSIEGYMDEEWVLKNEYGEQSYGSTLFTHEDAALAASIKQAEEQQERNARSYSQIKHSAKKMTWSVRYHRDCIKDLQQKIDYHTKAISVQGLSKRG